MSQPHIHCVRVRSCHSLEECYGINDAQSMTATSSSLTRSSNIRTRQPQYLLLFVLLCILSLLLPATIHAFAPRLLSSEYDIRTLHVGKIDTDTSSTSTSSSSSSIPSDSSYSLTWQRYEFVALDLIFDQPLFVSSADAVVRSDDTRKNNADSSPSPSSHRPHSIHHPQNHAVLAPSLRGAIVLNCSFDTTAGEYHIFSLDSWPTTSDYWSSPVPVLLPMYSSHNPMKAELIRMHESIVENGKSDEKKRKVSSSIFSASSSAATSASSSSPISSPNILSLMLMLSHTIGAPSSDTTTDPQHVGQQQTEEQEEEETRFVPDSIFHDDPSSKQGRNPMHSCRVVYQSVESRIEKVETEAKDTVAATSSSPTSSAFTNYRGYELTSLNSPLTLRKGRQIAWLDEEEEYTMYRISEEVEKEVMLGEDEMMEEADDTIHLQQNITSSTSTLPPFDPSDPFALILLDTSTSLQTQMIMLMLKPIANGVMKPATKGTADLLLDTFMTELGKNLFYGVVDEVAPDLNIMLGIAVETSATNILQDSLTWAITKSLTNAVVKSVSPYLIKRLNQDLPGPLHAIIQAILEKKIPTHLERTMPVILSRVLSLTLTHSLTRSIPHVVVPSLYFSLGMGHAGGLSRSKFYWEVCMRCYEQSVGRMPSQRSAPPDHNPNGYSNIGGAQRAGTECGACPTSSESMYYGIYQAEYFTDYYSEYYAEYYSQAMQLVDEAVYADDGAAHGTGGKEEKKK